MSKEKALLERIGAVDGPECFGKNKKKIRALARYIFKIKVDHMNLNNACCKLMNIINDLNGHVIELNQRIMALEGEKPNIASEDLNEGDSE